MANDKIVIKGAREHNLKNIDLTLPREKFIVMTGLSGSGKSSLAFDTIYADGQRRCAACMGGMLTVLDGEVRLVATTWEWAEQIDHARAEAAKKRAEELLARKDLDRREYEMAQARLKRALVRTSIKE